MSYPAYSEYRVSRHLWLDQIPIDWDSVNLRLIAKRSSGGTPDKSNSLFWTEGTIPWLNSGEVNQGVITEPTTFITENALTQSSAKWVPPNSIIIALAGQGKTKGMAAITTFRTTCNQSMAAVVFETDHPKFMYWWLVSQYKNIRGMASDDARDGLNLEMIATIPCPRPSSDEQQQIAAFLDWKTGQIDALIAKKKELMDKLKEKRLAVITQAVTKGLNPAAPLRDSGISWLGAVPEHWEVKPVKYLTKILRGQFSHRPRNDPAFYNGEYPFVQTGDIARAGKYVTTYSQTLNERGLSVSRQFPAGTLVMTIAANIGDMAIIEFPACFPDSIVGFIPETDIDLDFLYYMFIAMKQRLMMTAVLNTQLNLNIDRISSIETVEPPLIEQKKIVAHLDKEIERSERLMSKAESAIDRLTEYRTALITAATTGKIDVRQVPLPAHP